MSCNAFSNYSLEVDNTLSDAVCCGKILLKTTEWEISFICDFCHRNLPTLPELLRHTFNQHMEDVPPEKLVELCGIEKTEAAELKTEGCNGIEHDDRTLDDRIVQSPENAILDGDIEDDVVSEKPDRKIEVDVQLNEIDDEVDSELTKMQFEFFNVEAENGNSRTKTTQKKCKREKICKQCNVTLRNSREIRAHQRKHGEKPHRCKQCGAGFADKGNLRVHCFRHLGIKPHGCQVCAKAFTTTTELKAHMSSHTGERPYKCSQCDKAYASSGDLASHRFLHSNEKRQLCPTCGKRFYNRKSLRTHMSTHITERTHVCAKCDASFTTHKGLWQHMQLHSEVKKYSCQFCGKTFAQAAGVYSHVKTVHKNIKEAFENQ